MAGARIRTSPLARVPLVSRCMMLRIGGWTLRDLPTLAHLLDESELLFGMLADRRHYSLKLRLVANARKHRINFPTVPEPEAILPALQEVDSLSRAPQERGGGGTRLPEPQVAALEFPGGGIQRHQDHFENPARPFVLTRRQ